MLVVMLDRGGGGELFLDLLYVGAAIILIPIVSLVVVFGPIVWIWRFGKKAIEREKAADVIAKSHNEVKR